MAGHTIKQIAALLAPYAENGESAVVSKLKDFKDSPAFHAVVACVESAEKNPKFAADHYQRSTAHARIAGQEDHRDLRLRRSVVVASLGFGFLPVLGSP